jgi:hypothetical protein
VVKLGIDAADPVAYTNRVYAPALKEHAMSFYVAAYDTEAVYAWWEPANPDATGYEARVSYEGERRETFLAGARGQQQIAFCIQIYEYLCQHRDQAPEHPPL